MTKTQAVLNWLMSNASICDSEAAKSFGVMRLGSIIYNLRRKGYIIETVMDEGRDRFGNRSKFARYYLRGMPTGKL